jgi:hypothetical protein
MATEKCLLRGVLSGVAGGLAASWMMNEFLAGPGTALQHAAEGAPAIGQKLKPQDDPPKEDATMKAADAIVSTATGGRHLTWSEKEKAGPVVHYAFGALMGGLYGGLAEYSGAVTSGFGTTFGGALFGGADVLAVPALKLSPPLTEQSPATLISPFGAHIVYGFTTELVRRVVRKMF